MFTLHPSFWRTSALAMAIGLLSPLASLAAPLTEGEALRRALARPELAELASARIAEADAEVVAASTWANPALELSRDKTGAARESTWRIAQPLDVSGRRGLRQDAARLRLDATQADTRAGRAERAAEVRRGFHEEGRPGIVRNPQKKRLADCSKTKSHLADAKAGFHRPVLFN